MVYTAVKPSGKFLASYLPMVMLYLLIPALGTLCGHKVPAHEYLASFMAGNFIYFSVLYLKLVPENAVTSMAGLVISYVCDILYLSALFYALSFYLYFLANGGILQGDIILAIAQTNPGEALTYLETSFSGTQLAGLSSFLLAAATAGCLSARAFHRIHRKSTEHPTDIKETKTEKKSLKGSDFQGQFHPEIRKKAFTS